MIKYEAMFIIKPDLGDEEKKKVFHQIGEAALKVKGSIADSAVWAEKRPLTFKIKKYSEGLYYLLHFSAPASAVKELLRVYRMNEDVLRTFITRAEL